MKRIFELYALMNSDGQFMRAKGFSGGGNSWVNTLKTARIYTHVQPAKAQITYWKKNYPEYPAPKLVLLEATIKEIVDQTERTETIIQKQIENKKKAKINLLKRKQEEINKQITELNK